MDIKSIFSLGLFFVFSHFAFSSSSDNISANVDTVLHTLQAEGYTLTPTFNSDEYSYTLSLPCPVSAHEIHFIATGDSGVAVTYGGAATADGMFNIEDGGAGNNIVTVTVSGVTDGHSFSTAYTITVKQPLPSTLLRRLWDDILAVNLDSATNGGYTFTDFQWYGNGEIMRDHIGEYFYCEHGFSDSASYYVTLVTSTGDTLQTCPYLYLASETVELQAYPNPTSQGSVITIDMSALKTLPGSIEIYNAQGMLIHSFVPPKASTFTLQMPYPMGVYVIKAGKYSQKVVISK
jgi:hypothetical protein